MLSFNGRHFCQANYSDGRALARGLCLELSGYRGTAKRARAESGSRYGAALGGQILARAVAASPQSDELIRGFMADEDE